jgi:hypothetical protein
MSPAAFEAMSRSRSLPDEKRSAVWNKGPISIDLRTVGVELKVSTCFLADGVWSVGSVYDASALNHLLSTAIGCGARRFARPRGCEGGGKSERSPRVRPKQAEFRRARSLCRRRPGHPDVLYNCVQSENTGLTMSQQTPSGLLSLGRWTAKHCARSSAG